MYMYGWGVPDIKRIMWAFMILDDFEPNKEYSGKDYRDLKNPALPKTIPSCCFKLIRQEDITITKTEQLVAPDNYTNKLFANFNEQQKINAEKYHWLCMGHEIQNGQLCPRWSSSKYNDPNLVLDTRERTIPVKKNYYEIEADYLLAKTKNFSREEIFEWYEKYQSFVKIKKELDQQKKHFRSLYLL